MISMAVVEEMQDGHTRERASLEIKRFLSANAGGDSVRSQDLLSGRFIEKKGTFATLLFERAQ